MHREVLTADAGTHVAGIQTNGGRGKAIHDESVRLRLEVGYINYQYISVGDGADTSWHNSVFDIQNGTLDTAGSSTTSNTITARKGGGWIIEIEWTNSSVSTQGYDIYIYLVESGDVDAASSYTFTGDEKVALYNLQVCSASADNVYLKTTGISQYRGVNGNQTLIFDGVDDKLVTQAFTEAVQRPNNIFIVCQSWFDDVETFFMDGGSSGNQQSFSFDSTDRLILNSGAPLTGSADMETERVYVLEGLFSASNSEAYEDETLKISGNAGSNSFSQLKIGAEYTDNHPLLGRICEILIIDGELSDGERQKVREYLVDKWAATPVVQTDNLPNQTLKGSAQQDYIKTFTETSSARYWKVQYLIEDSNTSKVTHADLYIGKGYDFGDRGPSRAYSPPSYGSNEIGSVQSSGNSQFRSRAGALPNVFAFTWKVIGSNKDEWHSRIAKYWDVRPLYLYTTTSTQLLSEHELIKCWIEDFSVEAEAASSDVFTITATFREDTTP